MVKPLAKAISNHTPCVISIETSIPKCRLFRFENYWPLHPGFKETVQNSWNRHVRANNSALVLSAKLKRLRHDLKHWRRSISKLSTAIENCNKALVELDNIEDKRPLARQEWNFRRILKKHVLRLLDYKNKYWKKHCTYRWDKLGDENTKKIHARAMERYRRNNIAVLTSQDGRPLDSHLEKAAAFHEAFKNRMGIASQPDICLNLADLVQSVQGLDALSSKFMHEEIDEVVKHMPVDKAPGPNGFNGMFLKS
ncbi:hypothetical protein ACQ4PT_027458 [Festuca glaucescens]